LEENARQLPKTSHILAEEEMEVGRAVTTGLAIFSPWVPIVGIVFNVR